VELVLGNAEDAPGDLLAAHARAPGAAYSGALTSS
jgi:hypothetical protein